jgi:hypothetical protein
VQVAQQKKHAEQLQAKLNLMEGQVIDLKDFHTLSQENTYKDRSRAAETDLQNRDRPELLSRGKKIS